MKKRYASFIAAAGLFALLIVFSAEARTGAAAGLSLWAGLLVPSLLPYFAAAGLLMRLGFISALGRRIAPLGQRLLGVSGAGCGIFLVGLSGGYPLGASAIAEAFRAGTVTREEAESLLRFCDNTGPAFAVGALGVGVFHSAATGLALWGVHALCALLLGIVYRRSGAQGAAPARVTPPLSFSEALTASVSAAVSALLGIGGNVVFFSALLAIGETLGFPGALAALCADRLGLSADILVALFTGTLELSSGISAMASLPRCTSTLSLGSFLLGWGGLCVHFQTAAVTAGTELRLGGRFRAKLLHGLLSAAVTWLLSPFIL